MTSYNYIGMNILKGFMTRNVKEVNLDLASDSVFIMFHGIYASKFHACQIIGTASIELKSGDPQNKSS